MQAIWKFPMQCADKQVLALPTGAKVLCVQTQQEIPCMWVVNPSLQSATTENRTFAIYGTGHEHESIGGVYVGTFQRQGGALVFHVFEE